MLVLHILQYLTSKSFELATLLATLFLPWPCCIWLGWFFPSLSACVLVMLNLMHSPSLHTQRWAILVIIDYTMGEVTGCSYGASNSTPRWNKLNNIQFFPTHLVYYYCSQICIKLTLASHLLPLSPGSIASSGRACMVIEGRMSRGKRSITPTPTSRQQVQVKNTPPTLRTQECPSQLEDTLTYLHSHWFHCFLCLHCCQLSETGSWESKVEILLQRNHKRHRILLHFVLSSCHATLTSFTLTSPPQIPSPTQSPASSPRSQISIGFWAQKTTI